VLKSLSTSIFILLWAISFGQSGTIGTGAADNGISICADNAGNSFIGGTTGTKALIVRQDASNTTVWSKTLSFSANAQHTSEIGFIDVIGDTLFGCGYIRSGTGPIGCAYFKLNAQTGAAYWIFCETSSNHYFSSMRYSPGLFVLVGGYISGSVNDGKVMGISSQTGQLLWQTPRIGLEFPAYGVDFLDDFISASSIVNGKLFITGRSYVNGATSNDMRAHLIGIDITGNVFLKRYLLFNVAGGTINRFYGQRIEYDGADSLVVAYVGDDNCTGCTDLKSGILKCDLQGNVAFARYFNIQNVTSEIVRTFNITPTGYVIYGQVNTGQPDQRVFLLKTDKQGHFEDCALIAPNTGTYSVYSGVANLVSGNSIYRNGLHYFITNYTSGGQQDMRKLLVDADLNDLINCSVTEHPVVVETSFTPFSGPLNSTTSLSTIIPVAGTETAIVLPDACQGITVSIQQTDVDCSSVLLHATASGAGSPQFTWSNGATGATISVTSSEPLFLTVTNPVNCCLAYDTIVPAFSGGSGMDMSLPSDTSVCLSPGQSFTITPVIANPTGTLTYNWSTGSQAASLAISETGVYWVEVSDNCTTISDSLSVTVLFNPSITYEEAVSVCPADFPYLLTPTIANSNQITWDDGSSATTFSASGAGVYTVTAVNTCGSATWPTVVSEAALPSISYPAIDTCVQQGANVVIAPDASSGITSVSWSSGETSLSIVVQQSGIYHIVASGDCGTVEADCAVHIGYFPELFFPAVLDTCFDTDTGFSYTAPGTPGNYQWSSGSVSATEWIPGEGTYTCTLTNACGTVSEDLNVVLVTDVDLTLLQDSLLFCSAGIRVVDLGIETNYELELLSPEGNLIPEEVTYSGWYTIHAFNICGSVTDSVFINLQEEQYFYLPNTFTPNRDQSNELYVHSGANILIEEVLIRNRWGELVYQETGGFSGWSGSYKGLPSPDGVYQVHVLYYDCTGHPAEFYGHVTLLR